MNRWNGSGATLGHIAQRVAPWVLLAAAIAALAIHAAYYFPFFSDDALISLRYAKRFCGGQGLTWTDGERVEGYSDLLWVLLNVPATCARLNPIWSARALDFIGSAFALWLVALPSDRGVRPKTTRVIGGSIALAASVPIAVWSIGGLEHGFMTGVLAGALFYARRAPSELTRSDLFRASALFGLLCVLRIDGIGLFIAAMIGRQLGTSFKNPKELAIWMLFPGILLAAQFLFRFGYYHQFLPNTAIAKVSFNTHRLSQGMDHLKAGFMALGVLVLVATMGTLLAWRGVPRVRIAVPLVSVVVWSAYLGLIGGDIFPGWRQLVFVVVMLAFLVADGAQYIGERTRWSVAALAVSLWGVSLFLHVKVQLTDSENVRAKNEKWEWDGLPMGTALKRAFGAKRPLLAVDAAGALPYWSDLPSLDMLGLNDAYIPRHPPPNFGHGGIGHELGDADYIWRRSPDIIAFCSAVGNVDPCFVGGLGLFAKPNFRSTYQLVHVQPAPGVLGNLYVKRDGAVGIQRSDGRIDVPGHLFSAGPAVALLDEHGRLTPVVSQDAPGHLEALRVPAGTWRLSTQPPIETLQSDFACAGVSPRRLSAQSPHVIRLRAALPLDVVVAPTEGQPSTMLVSAALERADEGEPGFECDPQTPSFAVERGLAELDSGGRIGGYWAAPGVVRFGAYGLRVTLPHVLRPTHIGMLADGNDRYTLRFFRSGIVQSQTLVEAAGRGLQMRDVEVPSSIAEHGADTIVITPSGGDGAYSVGRLEIVE